LGTLGNIYRDLSGFGSVEPDGEHEGQTTHVRISPFGFEEDIWFPYCRKCRDTLRWSSDIATSIGPAQPSHRIVQMVESAREEALTRC
jgi:hypothetical protein